MKMRWRCDKAMAMRKGIRRHCDGKCRDCLCGIYVDEWGQEGHHIDMREGCGNFSIRNMAHMRGRAIE